MGEFTLSGNAYFDGVSQPVLLVKDRKIKYCNPAAQAIFRACDHPSAEDAPAPGGLPERDGVSAELNMGGERWTVRSRGLGDGGTLCLFERAGDGGLSPQRVRELAVQLRRLLGPLNASIETLQNTLVETEQHRNEKWISYLNHSQHKLLRLVDDLDFYSQSDDDLAVLYPCGPLELTGVCRELEHLLDYLLRQIGCRFVYREEASGATVWANEYLLRRLLYNLTANGLGQKGELVLTLRVTEERAVLTLEDSAGGIPPEKLERAFAPEADRLLADGSPEGFGLGLPICRRIAHFFGGTLLLAPAGEGTAVTLSLPLCSPSQRNLLRDEGIFDPAQNYNQVLTELSGVLPARCYGQETVF
ncbi:MAG: HAMP domain-containing histidine kinase [Clostridiales bacterium]|nr:HAMP domain-containing histidine kinase [Clostridiales bacterium]